MGRKPPHITAHLNSRDWSNVKRLSSLMPTITSLRHPARIILSHLARREREGRKFDECGAKFWREWQRLCKLRAFRFPLEVMPFDELEEFIGRPVNRIDRVIRSVGDYPEKHDMELARERLKHLWEYVEYALDTPDGRIYNAENFDADYRRIPKNSARAA